jgi:hypothetical protein
VVHLDGLEELLRRVVREELAAAHDGWLDSEAAAEYLGCGVPEGAPTAVPARGLGRLRGVSGAAVVTPRSGDSLSPRARPTQLHNLVSAGRLPRHGGRCGYRT